MKVRASTMCSWKDFFREEGKGGGTWTACSTRRSEEEKVSETESIVLVPRGELGVCGAQVCDVFQCVVGSHAFFDELSKLLH